MILAVDIGNTNIVVGGFEGNGIRFTERITTDPNRTVLEYEISFRSVLELNGVSGGIEGAVISSVVPSLTDIMRRTLKSFVTGRIIIAGRGVKTGINILTDNPQQVGTDRIVDAVAVAENYPLPAVIIDMGTATTISVINGQRQFIGGIIMAGVRISLDALTGKTAQLPSVSFESPPDVIGRNTTDCIKSGIINGTASCIDGIISRIEKSLGQKVTAVATGGMSGLIIPHCEREIICDDDLLIKGLICIWNKNN